jgi:glutamate dehydrogenase (NAD(P)+)
MLRDAYRPPGEAGLWGQFLAHLEQTLRACQAHPSTVEYLTHPRRIVTVSLPVKMDDGSVRFFTGYRVVHNITRGPSLGGVRYHPQVTLGQTAGLAAWMTLKAAVHNLPYSGSAGGIAVDPKLLSRRELERLSRRYVSELTNLLGPDLDILSSDVGTDDQVMAWFMDTYSMNVGETVPGVVTDKPVALGGAELPGAAGEGLLLVLEEFAHRRGWPLEGATLAVQGWGRVGRGVAQAAQARGLKVVALSTSRGGLYDPKGLDLDEPKGQVISNEELLRLPVDYLVPAAIEGIIDANATEVQARVVVEGANAPVTPLGERILRSRGIEVIPDLLANGGGLVLSYLEWVQDLNMLFWEPPELKEQLRSSVVQTVAAVIAKAEALGSDLRTATWALAVERINEGTRLRGVYP